VAHLGDRVAALVDGQLSADAVERAHAHLAGCRPCREVVEAERLMKARLASLPGPEPETDLVERLLALGGPNGPLPPRVGHVPGSPRPQAVALPRMSALSRLMPPASEPGGEYLVDDPATEAPVPAALRVPAGTLVGVAGADRPAVRPPGRQARRSGSTGPGRPRPRRPGRLAVAAVFGALSMVGVGVAGLVVSGSGNAPASPALNPPVDTFVIDHARTTSNLPFVDVPAGWQLTGTGEDGGAGR
jgi:hypothetical protein